MAETHVQPELNIASNSLEKGEVRDGKQLVAWDCVQECNLEQCPIRNTCTYVADTIGEKCRLQTEYLQALTDTIFRTYRYLNDEVLFKIGMNLIPLYSQLCRQKIVEKSVVLLAYEDAKGVTRIHPIYKEIRETLKTITVIWKEIGFTPIVPPDPTKINHPEGALVGRPGFGDPNHYATISQTVDMKGVVR